jgi:hypothetical protein
MMRTLSSQALRRSQRNFVSERLRNDMTPSLLMMSLISGRGFCFLLILLTVGGLAGCSDPDALAVASGPLFPLNAGHWQPTPQDLAAPPVVVDR